MSRLSVLLTLCLLAGCSRESEIKTKKTVETPEGKTTITTEQKIEKSGKNPPAVP